MWRRRSGFPSSHRSGILQAEMFAEKSMDVNSSLLKLKLDMVYRNLSTEEAQKVYSELTATVPPKEPIPPTIIKRKVVKALVPQMK
jgi:hypothetical protein